MKKRRWSRAPRVVPEGTRVAICQHLRDSKRDWCWYTLAALAIAEICPWAAVCEACHVKVQSGASLAGILVEVSVLPEDIEISAQVRQ